MPALQPYYPRSLALLLGVAMLVVTAPLLFGLAHSIRLLQDRLTAQHEFARVSLQVSRDLRRADESIDAWQRAAGQYHLLRDDDFAPLLQGQHALLETSLQRLQRQLVSAAHRRLAERLDRERAALYARVAPGKVLRQAEFMALSPAFETLHFTAADLMRRVDARIERDQRAQAQDLATARRELIVLALALLPLTVALAFLLSWLIHRPFGQLKHALQQLGDDATAPLPTLTGPHDLTELGHDIGRLQARLLEIDEQQAQFLRHAAHELRTPLASLREGVALLHDGVAGTLAPRQRGIVEILAASVQSLQKQVEDLLLYRALRGGRAPVQPQSLDLAQLIEKVRAHHALSLARRKLGVELALAAPTLVADPVQLETVLDTLLSHAITFSRSGEIIRIASRPVGNRAETGVEIDFCRGGGIGAVRQATGPAAGTLDGSAPELSGVREILLAVGGSIVVTDGESRTICLRILWPQLQLGGI